MLIVLKMYKNGVKFSWGHTAHRGWARLLYASRHLDRAWYLHQPRPGAPRRQRRSNLDGRRQPGRSLIP